MVHSGNARIVIDNKKRKLLELKKEGTFYLLNQKNEKFAIFLKNNVLNAISISVMIGYFLNLPYWLWVIVAAILYGAYMLFFNKRILPSLSIVKSKHILIEKKTIDSKKRILFFAVGFIAISIGLLLCVIYNQINGEYNEWIVSCFSVFALLMSIKHFKEYLHYEAK